MDKKREILHRVVTFLKREELDFLDNITKDIFFSTGIKIPRSTILKELIDVFLYSPQLTKNHNYKNLILSIEQKLKKKGGKNG